MHVYENKSLTFRSLGIRIWFSEHYVTHSKAKIQKGEGKKGNKNHSSQCLVAKGRTMYNYLCYIDFIFKQFFFLFVHKSSQTPETDTITLIVVYAWIVHVHGNR